jgi:hypothetical protein
VCTFIVWYTLLELGVAPAEWRPPGTRCVVYARSI